MKKKRLRIAWILFSILGLVNAYFFIQRNKFGTYVRQVSYEQLYPPPFSQADLKKWQKTLSPYSSAEIQEGQKISKEETGILETDPTIVKVEKIGKWLAPILHACPKGRPDSSLINLTPAELLNVYKNRETRVWCGNYAAMFSFYCAVNNITVRSVEAINHKVSANNHAVNECFIPETGKWAMTDLTYNILHVTDDKNNLLNTVDVINFQHQNKKIIPRFAGSPVADSTYTDSGIPAEWKNYLSNEANLIFYYSTDLPEIYSPYQNIKRYLLPVTWYELYTPQRVSNLWFYVRQFMLVIWLIVLIFIVIGVPRMKKI